MRRGGEAGWSKEWVETNYSGLLGILRGYLWREDAFQCRWGRWGQRRRARSQSMCVTQHFSRSQGESHSRISTHNVPPPRLSAPPCPFWALWRRKEYASQASLCRISGQIRVQRLACVPSLQQAFPGIQRATQIPLVTPVQGRSTGNNTILLQFRPSRI